MKRTPRYFKDFFVECESVLRILPFKRLKRETETSMLKGCYCEYRRLLTYADVGMHRLDYVGLMFELTLSSQNSLLSCSSVNTIILR